MEEPPIPVDPEVSGAWTWEQCGSLLPEPADLAAVFDSSGGIAVLGRSGVKLYDPEGAPLSSTLVANADFLVTAPDGSVLTVHSTPTEVALTPLGSDSPRLVLPYPPRVNCGARVAFSSDGAYVLRSAEEVTCAWRVSDASFVGSVSGRQGTMRGSRFVTLEGGGPVDVVERDLAGVELSRRPIGDLSVVLSPAGDRAVDPTNRSLVEVSTGRTVALDFQANVSGSPVFSAGGEMVLVGDGVFRTVDGVRVFTIPVGGRLRRLSVSGLSLSPDGSRVVGLGFGRAALLDVESKGVRAVLGPPLAPDSDREGTGVTDLAISRDGTLLVYYIAGMGSFGVRIAPKLAESKTLWDMRVELGSAVDVSRDGQLVIVGGDGRALFDGRDGQPIWAAEPPPPNVSIDNVCLQDRLRFSPKATWLATSDYSRALQIFRMDGGPSWQPLLELPGECDAAAFSRNEKLMATSAVALYRTGASPKDWTQVWSRPIAKMPPSLEYPVDDIEFSPDDTQLLVSNCDPRRDRCSTALVDVATGSVSRQLPELNGRHPTFSPDGSWIIAADKLLHLPSGRLQVLSGVASPINPALFTPDGDIIAGGPDGAVTRYCRNEGY